MHTSTHFFTQLLGFSPLSKLSKSNASKNSKKGFTLLELLVVISILGILMAMGAVAFTTAQKKGRDAKRRADVKVMQDAFEQYYSATSSVYAACATMANSTYLPGGLPTDPQTGATYTCNGTTTTYCTCALLENTGSGNATTNGCAYGTGASANYFCVSNLQ